MPDDQEQVTIQGYAAVPGDDPLGPLIPVRVRVPANHRFLSTREGGTAPLPVDDVEEQLGTTRELSKLVADRAARAAMERARGHMKDRLDAMRPALVAAAQEAIREHFGEAQRDGRRPLTWDTASLAVDAVIGTLVREAW